MAEACLQRWMAKRAAMRVPVRLQPIGGAPPISRDTFEFPGDLTMLGLKAKVSGLTQVVPGGEEVDDDTYLAAEDHLYLYVNNVFEPLDTEYLGDLYEIFVQKSGQSQISLGYSKTKAFA